MEIKEVVIGTSEVSEEKEMKNGNLIITLDVNEVNMCAAELEHLLYDNVHCNNHIPHINATKLTRIASINHVLDQIKSWTLEETHLPLSAPSVIAETKIPELVLQCLYCERPVIVMLCLEIVHHLVQHNNSFDKVKMSAIELCSQEEKTANTDVAIQSNIKKTLINNNVQEIPFNCSSLISLLVKIMKAYAKKVEIQVEVMNVLRVVLNKEVEHKESTHLESRQQELQSTEKHVNAEIVNLIVSVMYRESDCAEVQIAALSLLTAISINWPVFWELYSNSVFTLPVNVSITTNPTLSKMNTTIDVTLWTLLLDALATYWNNLEMKRTCLHFLRNALQHDYVKFCVLQLTLPLKIESSTVRVEELIHNTVSECKVWESIWDSCIRAIPLSAYTLDVFRDVGEILGHLLPLATFIQVEELMKLLRMLLLKHGTTEVLTLALGLLHAIFLKINYQTKYKERVNALDLPELCTKPSIASVHGAYQLYPQPHREQTHEHVEEKEINSSHKMKSESDSDNAQVQLCVRAIVDLCLPQLIMHVIEYHQHALTTQQVLTKNDDDTYDNDDNDDGGANTTNDVNLELLCVIAQNCLKALPL